MRWARVIACVAGAVLFVQMDVVVGQNKPQAAFVPPANGPARNDSTWVALVGGVVYPEPGRVLMGATVVIRNGVITAVLEAQPGPDNVMGTADDIAPKLPLGPRVVDCRGEHVYPAFVEAYCEVPGGAARAREEAGGDGVVWNDEVMPDRSVLDAPRPEAILAVLRGRGFGTAGIVPNKGIFRGRAAAVSTSAVDEDASKPRPATYAEDVYQGVTFQYRGVDRGYPDSMMGAIAVVRQTLADADWQAASRAWARRNGVGNEVKNALDYLAPVKFSRADFGQANFGQAKQVDEVARASVLMFNADDELDGLRALVVAKEFARPAGIVGSGREYRRLPALLTRIREVQAASVAGASVAGTGGSQANETPLLLPVNFVKEPDVSSIAAQESMELVTMMGWEQDPTNPARVIAAARASNTRVAMALTTNRLRSGDNFVGKVRTAIAHGLAAEDAFAAVTSTPAKILGVDAQVGTLGIGKRANIVTSDVAIFTSAADALAQSPTLRAVYVDGVRHELAPTPGMQGKGLEGEWAISVVGAGNAVAKVSEKEGENKAEKKDVGMPAGIMLKFDDKGQIVMMQQVPKEEAKKVDAAEAAKQEKDEAKEEDKPKEDAKPKEDPKQEVKLVETKLSVTKLSVTKLSETKRVDASNVLLTQHSLTFQFDRYELDGKRGIVSMSGAVRNDERGKPMMLVGQGLTGDAERFQWTATRIVATKPIGQWRMSKTQDTNFALTSTAQLFVIVEEDSARITFVSRDEQGKIQFAVAKGKKPTFEGEKCVFVIEDANLTGLRECGIDVAAGDARVTITRVGAANVKGTFEQGIVAEVKAEPKAANVEAKQDELAKDLAKDVTKDLAKNVAAAAIEPVAPSIAALVAVEVNAPSAVVPELANPVVEPAKATGPTIVLELETADRVPSEKALKAARVMEARIAAIPKETPTPFGPNGVYAEPIQPALVAFTNATIWTQTSRGVVVGGTLVIGNGKIVSVLDAGAAVPSGAAVIDCAGKHITPGIIDCHSHVGISKGVNESGQAITAEVRISDVTDPDDMDWYRQLASGVTLVNNLHGSANCIGGQSQTNKIRWGCADPSQMHMEGAPAGIKFALGENPTQVNWGLSTRARYPISRMGIAALIRDRFTQAKAYSGARAGVKAGANEAGQKDVLPLRRDLELEAIAEVLAGTMKIHCHAYRVDEMHMLIDLTTEFGVRIGTFQHVLEGYKLAAEIRDKTGGGSGFSDWWAFKMEVQDAIPQGLPMMAEVGAVVSYNSDSAELVRRLNVEAAKAVRYSEGRMSEPDALNFVTLNPAKQLGVESRVGSIAAGLDADVAIWNGKPLSGFTRCVSTWVDGRELFSDAIDAANRETIAKERVRLIQKIQKVSDARDEAADAKGEKKDEEKEGKDATPSNMEAPSSIDRLDEAGRAALRRMYMERFMSGQVTPDMQPGFCGCH